MAQKSAAVVVGGIMGAGIAQVLARSGYEIAVREITEELAAEARERVVSGNYGLDDAVEGGYLSEYEKAAVLERLTFTTDLDATTDGTDFTIEAVTEDLAIKGEVFRDLDSVTDDQPLYSNTSGFSVTAIANGVADPSRVAVTHFFNPVPIMSMVEIVRTPQTDAAVVARAPRTWSTNSARPASQSTTTPAPTASSPTAVTRQYARRPGRSSTKGSRLNRKSIKRSRRVQPPRRPVLAARHRRGVGLRGRFRQSLRMVVSFRSTNRMRWRNRSGVGRRPFVVPAISRRIRARDPRRTPPPPPRGPRSRGAA